MDKKVCDTNVNRIRKKRKDGREEETKDEK